MAVDAFIDGHTPFATKHGVKGAEFENVLVIVGRGWNKYNFAQMLERLDPGPPADKVESFESNRNLFYVACSRPTRRDRKSVGEGKRVSSRVDLGGRRRIKKK